MLLVAVIVFSLLIVTGLNAAEWSYDGDTGPSHWCSLSEGCCGSSQSPIDLNFHAQPMATTRFKFYDYDVIPSTMIIENNGHSAALRISDGNVSPRISGGGLRGTYAFHSLHFHWGNDSRRGSEHTLLGFRYPIELHMVHYSTRFGSLQDALASRASDALAVLGIFYTQTREDNPSVSPISNSLSSILYSGQSSTLERPFHLSSLLPKSSALFFRYMGSLTTPTCNEAVVWTVFAMVDTISEKQLHSFRSMFYTEENEDPAHMVNNFRPPQPLNGRSLNFVFALV